MRKYKIVQDPLIEVMSYKLLKYATLNCAFRWTHQIDGLYLIRPHVIVNVLLPKQC
jgi:hypothetical protein